MILPSNDVDLLKLKDGIKEISNSWTRIEGERQFVKDALDRLEEELDVSKKDVRKLAKIYHQQNLDQVLEEYQEIEVAYNRIMNTRPNALLE
jgi:CBS-domain-containing membrane protein